MEFSKIWILESWWKIYWSWKGAEGIRRHTYSASHRRRSNCTEIRFRIDFQVIGKTERNFGCHDHWFFNFDVQISVSILCAVCRAIERGQQFYSKSIRRANPERLTIRKDFSLAQVVGVRSREKLKTNLHFPFCPDVFLRIWTSPTSATI